MVSPDVLDRSAPPQATCQPEAMAAWRERSRAVRISLRLIICLVLGVTLVALLFAYSQVNAEKRALRSDLENRAALQADGLAQSVELLLQKRSRKELQVLLNRLGNTEKLAGVVVYDEQHRPVAMTSQLADGLDRPPTAVERAITQNHCVGEFFNFGQTPMHVFAVALDQDKRRPLPLRCDMTLGGPSVTIVPAKSE